MNNETFIPAIHKKFDLKVIDPDWETVFEKTGYVLSEFGSIDGEFAVPESSPAGWYKFQISNPSSGLKLEPMEVLIINFNSTPFNFTTEINGNIFETNGEVIVSLKAMLHTGSAFDASAGITSVIYPQPSKMFFNLSERGLSGFEFDTTDTFNRVKPVQIFKHETYSPDETGKLVAIFRIPENDILFGELAIESTVKDEQDEYLTSIKSLKYAARDRYVGIRRDNNTYPQDNPYFLEFITVDRNGKPVSGVPINIIVEFEEESTRREKGIGNTSIIKYIQEWKPIETRIIKSGEKPVPFIYTPEMFGNYRITGVIKDTKGREHSTQVIELLDPGEQNIIDSYDNLIIIPEKTTYKVGDTAIYRVKNPFPGAKALITVEKNGILKQWIQDFITEEPVIKLKIEENFIPEYHLSVVVMTPRTAPPPDFNQVDHGRPDFKAGSIKTTVDDLYKELDIVIKPEKMVYRSGEKVKVILEVSSKYIEETEPVELAVVVLNEEVLSSMPHDVKYFDPYKGFYSNIDHSVRNYNLLTQLISNLRTDKWPYFAVAASMPYSSVNFTLEEVAVTTEKEEASLQMTGRMEGPFMPSYTPRDRESTFEESFGEINALNLRSNIKYMTYWNPSIITDTKGKVSFEFEAPDNLTEWHVLVMAVTPTDRMGMGKGSFIKQ